MIAVLHHPSLFGEAVKVLTLLGLLGLVMFRAWAWDARRRSTPTVHTRRKEATR